VLYNPALQPWAYPEAVYAQSNNAKQEPLNPLAEQADPGAGKFKLEAFDVGVLGDPPLT
jgi:hypothetical protein